MPTLGSFRFKKTKSDYLLTNDVGDYAFVSFKDFNNLASGFLSEISLKDATILKDRGFINLNAASLKLENSIVLKIVSWGWGQTCI